MPTGRSVRTGRRFMFCLAVLLCLGIPAAAPPAVAQGQQVRLGDLRVDWYCLQRSNSAWIINDGTDWACTASNGSVTVVLTSADFNIICQNFYNNPAAYVLRDRSSSHPALDWSCYVTVPPTPTATILPTVAMQPSRLGEFQVEWYCNERGFGVRLINNDTDWACTGPGNDRIAFILNKADFDTICRRTYGIPDAYALSDQHKPQQAYNWSCYVNVVMPPTLTPIPPTPMPRLTRLGEFQVEWYCAERGLGVRVVNNDVDWACMKPNSDQVSFVLTQQDFDQICRRTYNDATAFALRDQNKPQPAYNWSCFTYRVSVAG